MCISMLPKEEINQIKMQLIIPVQITRCYILRSVLRLDVWLSRKEVASQLGYRLQTSSLSLSVLPVSLVPFIHFILRVNILPAFGMFWHACFIFLKVRWRHGLSWSWSCGWLCTTVYVLWVELESSPLTPWAASPAPAFAPLMPPWCGYLCNPILKCTLP